MKNLYKRYSFLALVLVLVVSGMFAQTGPAGVGNASGENGQPQNIIWYDASSLNLSHNEFLEVWPDISGNSNHAEQSVETSRPQFRVNQLNNRPAIFFDGSDDFLPFDGNVIANSDYTVLFVGKRRSNSTFKALFGGTGSGANTNLHVYWFNDTQIRSHHWGNDLQTNMVAAAQPHSGGRAVNTYGIFATSLNSSLSTAHRKNFQNNSFLGARNVANQLTTWNGAALGRYNTGYHDVDVAEFIIYRSALNTAQMQIISQYLSLKYDITINNNLFTPPAGYRENMAGIGRESDGFHTEASVNGFYIRENGGFNNGDYLFISVNDEVNDAPVFTDLPSGVEERWKQDIYLQKTGSFNASVIFDLSEGILNGNYPSDIENYVLLYRSTASGSYAVVPGVNASFGSNTQVKFDVPDASLQDGYYTLGTTDQFASPVIGKDGVTWYTLVSGEWTDPQIWTLDPAGMLPNNPTNSYPQQASDNVVVRNGRTVVVNQDDLIGSRLVVEGRLDMGTTQGHTFGEIRGTGRILMAADNFPDGDASHFTGKGRGEGTVQFYGGSYSITNARTFYDVQVELSNPSETLTILNNLTVEGYLKIDRGGIRINDNSSTSILNIDVKGNVYVENQGNISTGSGNTIGSYSIGGTMPPIGQYHSIYHQFRVGGDFINRGSVRFTNLTAPVYNQFASNGAVTLRFYGETNNSMELYGTTDLYNLILEKGNDRTYTLEVYSDSNDFFTLYGPNNAGRVTSSPFSAANPEVRKALWIRSGTLKLTGEIHIPTLTEGNASGGNGDYAIGQNGALWIAGAGVAVYSTASNQDQIPGFESTAAGVTTGGSNQAMSVYGAFRISDGFFGTRNSAGFIFWAEAYAQVRIDGGEIDVAQFRSGAVGGGKTSFTQTGGLFRVRGNITEPAEKSSSYAIFGFDSETSVFNMSGGQIILNDTGGGDVNGLYIPSTEGNFNVTGGTIIVDVPNNRTFEISSNANLWNLEVRRYNTSGTATVLLKDDLKVGRDLIINANSLLDAQSGSDVFDLYIGRHFDLRNGGQYNARDNTTHFYGTQSGNILARNNSVPAPLVFNHVNIMKDQAWNPSVFRSVSLGSTGRTTDPEEANNTAIEIQGNLKITRGEFNTFRYKVSHRGNIEIVDGRILANATNSGRIVLNGSDSEQTLKGALTQQQSFGNIELDNSHGAKLLSNISVSDIYLRQGVMNLDTYNLRVEGSPATIPADGFSQTRMFKTAGSPGNGGLTRFIDLSQGSADTEYLFPIGTETGYSPLIVTQSTTISDDGSITAKPINAYHPTLEAGNSNHTVPYYWIVTTDDFSTLVKENLKYTFFSPVNASPSANRGAWLNYEDYTWSSLNNIVQNRNRINFPYSVELEGEYTIGNNSTFKNPTIYYSTLMNANNSTNFGERDKWHDASRWSTVGHYSTTNTGTYPQQGDIAIIGFGLANPTATVDNAQRSHWFFVDQDVDVAMLVFANEVLNANGVSVPRSSSFLPQIIINNSAALNVNFAVVKGEGTFNVRIGCTSCNANPDVSNTITANISGDFNDFANNLNSRFDYDLYTSNNSAVYLPSNFPSVYPNVHVKGQNGTNRVLIFNEDVLIKRDLTIRQGATLRLSGNEFGDMEVYGNIDFTINDRADILEFPSTGYERTLTVHGDIIMDDSNNDQIRVLNTTPSNLVHVLNLGGDLIQGNNSSINLFTNNTGGNNVVLRLTGDNNGEYTRTGGTAASFYRIIMDKQSNRNFTFRDAFTLGGPTDGDHKAIDLRGGSLRLWNSGIDVMLSSGGADFRIPSGTGLYLGSGATARVSGDNTGIWLDGTLTAGFNTNLFINEGINNYIEYTSSGNSEINLHQATLLVGSQIRRSELAEEGVLTFRQNQVNSTVKIGTNAHLGGAANRGVFEMVSPGSTFYQAAGARMSIVNAIPNATAPSLLFNIDESQANIGVGSTIAFGDAETDESQTFGIYSTVELQDLHIDNQSENNPVLNINTVDVSLDNLIIDAGSTLRANGRTVTLLGDFDGFGEYIPSQNTTVFTGAKDQHITGNAQFFNLQKQGSSDLILSENSTDIIINNIFNFSSGNLIGNNNEIEVKGDLFFDGVYIHSGSSKGIVMSGLETQRLTGSGVFGMLTINNPSGVDVPIGNQLSISNRLRLERGVFNIGRNLLVLGVDAEVEAGEPFSVNNMIQTNISFTDNGVLKYLPSGSGTYIFPMGSSGKYTPVTIDATSTTSSNGSLLVKPAGEHHPSVTDPDNVLHYHWVLRADGLLDFTGTARMRYYPVDVKPTIANIDNYWAARLLSDGSGDWNKFPGDEAINVPGNELVFSFSGANDDGISGDYTAGLNAAIPDQVPTYISTKAGDWNQSSTWDTYPESGGIVPGGGPRGSMVIVAHEVNVPGNFISSYRTTINNNGKLNIGTTFGHRLGEVSGNGVLSIERGDLPAGVYDEFFSSTGGTLEFTGSDNYDVLSDITVVNNLIFSGAGQRRLPNLNLQLLGDLTIDGVSLRNEHNRTLSVRGNVLFNSGSFDAGFGANSRVVFNGTSQQLVEGSNSFTLASKFHRLEISNNSNVLFRTDADVDQILTLSAGRLVVENGVSFSVLNASSAAIVGASSQRFIDGALYKRINSGSSFDFPVGNGSRYGRLVLSDVNTSGMWRVQYFNSSPNGAGLPTSSKEDPVQFVSSNEYWNIEAPASATAHVTMRWDASSGVNPAETGLRGVQWLTDKWHEVILTNVTGTQSAGSARTSSLMSFNANAAGNYVAFGAITIPTYSWTGSGGNNNWFNAANWAGGSIPSGSSDITIGTATPFPTISGTSVAQVNNLTISEGGQLTLLPGGKLTVNGNLDVESAGGLIIESETGIGNMASIITQGEVTGLTNIKLTIPKEQWFYLGSSIQNATFGNFSPGAQGSGTLVNVYRDRWYSTFTQHHGTAMRDMEGVAVYYHKTNEEDNFMELSYSGVLNTGEIERTFLENRYQLMANPYPSFINWQNNTGWNREHFEPTIWYRALIGEAMTFVTYNRAAVPGARVALYPTGESYNEEEMGLIPPMQSVYVRPLGANRTITIDNAARSHGVFDSRLKSSESSYGDVIRITADNGLSRDGAVIYFTRNATENIDEGDSEKYRNSDDRVPEIFTRVNGVDLAINGLPELHVSVRTIPLIVRNRVSGDVTLMFDMSYYYGMHSVYLEDRDTGAFIHVTAGGEYVYTVSEPGERDDRFVLHFYMVSTDLEPEMEDPSAAAGIRINGVAGKALVSIDSQLLQMSDANIEVFSIEGQKVSETKAQSSRTLVVLPRTSAIFIVRVTAGDVVKSERVVGVR
ncbi:hypothetical protein [Natronoflexus pectinivorans]|uniref:Secreted protein (Por secretion system target) n=1 Tax=Natronoflexus pectinivorans TaxID=682526 RepID=A0A4R2GGJ4_9BACT|nr:hypothetical protein [Natronoflexus pectinivorans]TCO07429.1 hypothetical protein EV194_10834 [Natronoflexus pectinivorans]